MFRAVRLRGALLMVLGFLASACPQSDFSILIEAADGGALLSSWTDGDTLYSVGGGLDGNSGLLTRTTSSGWCSDAVSIPRTGWWIHGLGDDRYFIVGADGLILRHEAGVFYDESVPTESVLYGVWDEGDRVIAVGGDVWGDQTGEVWRRAATGAWTLLHDEVPGVLFKVWENWIVGDGVAYTLDSTDELVDRTPEGAPKLLTVRGRSTDDVWAVGGASSGVVVHWDGANWTEVDVPPRCGFQPLNGVWTAPDQPLWIAGMFGVVASYDGETWTCPEEQPFSSEHFHAVWPGLEDEMLWVGGNLFSQSNNYATVARYGLPSESLDGSEPFPKVEVEACP